MRSTWMIALVAVLGLGLVAPCPAVCALSANPADVSDGRADARDAAMPACHHAERAPGSDGSASAGAGPGYSGRELPMGELPMGEGGGCCSDRDHASALKRSPDADPAPFARLVAAPYASLGPAVPGLRTWGPAVWAPGSPAPPALRACNPPLLI